MVKSEQLPAGTRLCHRDSGEWALESEATGTVLFSGSTMDEVLGKAFDNGVSREERAMDALKQARGVLVLFRDDAGLWTVGRPDTVDLTWSTGIGRPDGTWVETVYDLVELLCDRTIRERLTGTKL